MKTPLPPRDFDFAVFGEHPAALWAAGLAADCGFKVMVVPLGYAPERSLIPRFVCESLQFEPQSIQEIQVVTSFRRCLLPKTIDQFSQEHRFQFGKDLDPVMGPDPEVLRGLLTLARGEETAPTVSLSWQEAYQQYQKSVFLKPGYTTLQQQMLSILKKKGVKVFGADSHQNELTHVFIEKRKLVGVQLKGQNGVVTIDQGVLAAPYECFRPLLNIDGNPFEEGKPSELKILDSKLRSRPLGWKFEVQLEVSPEAIPLGISERMVISQVEAPVVDIRQTRPGHFRLQVVLPYQDQSFDRAYQRRLAQRLVRLQQSMIPDLPYNLRSSVPDIRDPEAAERDELPRLYPFESVDEIPLELRVYGHPGIGFKSPIEGLGIAQDESDPRFGEWGAYRAVQLLLSAWMKRSDKLEQPKRQPLVDKINQQLSQ